jgi:serine/threonine protein kinase
MRYLHTAGVVHRDLRPDNIFLDWDWNVRIGGFGHSVCGKSSVDDRLLEAGKWSYLAPECFYGKFSQKSDVFAFGLILYELLVGEPAFGKEGRGLYIMKQIAIDEFRPAIPDWVAREVEELISDCWAHEANDRPSFADILARLEAMDFKLTDEVNSVKLRRFVKEVKERELANAVAASSRTKKNRSR